MEKKTGESLYKMVERVKEKVPLIEKLETGEIGELVLKISCIVQDKKPSGVNYTKLDFDKVLKDENKIIAGIRWTIEKLSELHIWHGNQLPSVVPLRVLPTLHRHIPRSKIKLDDTNRIIAKYLWHAFLTNRYEKHANDHLRKDYYNLKSYFDGEAEEQSIEIFKCGPPDSQKIREAGWPKSRNNLPRGILLVCCQRGAKALESNENLSETTYLGREKHHIFPRSKVKKALGHYGDKVVNCMLVPREDNRKYDNELPGDYIEKLFNDLNTSLPQIKVVERLETHLISRSLAEGLVRTKQEAILRGGLSLGEAYNKFMEDRAHKIETAIRELLCGEAPR